MILTRELVIETEIYRMELRPDGIISVEPSRDRDELEVTRELIDELIEHLLNLSQGKPRPVLFIYHNVYVSLPKETMHYIKHHKQLNRIKLAEAITTSSLASRITANFYLTIVKPAKPARLFSKPEKAVKWLLKFVED